MNHPADSSPDRESALYGTIPRGQRLIWRAIPEGSWTEEATPKAPRPIVLHSFRILEQERDRLVVVPLELFGPDGSIRPAGAVYDIQPRSMQLRSRTRNINGHDTPAQAVWDRIIRWVGSARWLTCSFGDGDDASPDDGTHLQDALDIARAFRLLPPDPQRAREVFELARQRLDASARILGSASQLLGSAPEA